MVRASAVAEKAGVRSVSLVSSGFVRQAHAIAKALGVENLSIAEYPGVPMIDSPEQLLDKVEQVLVTRIVDGLSAPAKEGSRPCEPQPRDVVYKGTLDGVQDFFYRNMWTEGLPVIPPTIARVEEFLTFTERFGDEVIGVLLPENRQATVWNVAVNGVMAGCRPEYMPLLLAVVEAISDPEFRIEDAGSTPGWEPLIILNGPIIRQLDFNCGSGVMRVGRQANTTVGRFLRLYMRNVAGLRIPPGDTDKGSICQTFNVALAENEDAVEKAGWRPFSVDRGFNAGDNIVTVQSCISISPPCYSGGTTPQEHMETITEIIGRRSVVYWVGIGAKEGKMHVLLVLSPSVAEVIAQGGWTKDDVRQYLYENAKAPAGLVEKLTRQAGPSTFTLCRFVEEGLISKEFCRSDDPHRLVPIILRPDFVEIVVSGDPGRNQSKGYVQNQKQGPPISKRIVLPPNWERMIEEVR
ncbi:MAG: hypothetical protein HYX92_05775 [Chloroflexi bacterium]|nr:hypothetical protein [Chloroflexota bacterium]